MSQAGVRDAGARRAQAQALDLLQQGHAAGVVAHARPVAQLGLPALSALRALVGRQAAPLALARPRITLASSSWTSSRGTAPLENQSTTAPREIPSS